MSEVILQQNANRKKGFWICKGCGVCGSFSDRKITESHLNGAGCKKIIKIFNGDLHKINN